MNVRLIASRIEQGVIHIYPLLCMDCEGDVFEWVNSVTVQDARTDEYFTLGSYRCIHCGFVHNLDERTFLMEATDEDAAWLAGRHVGATVRAGRNHPLNEGVGDGSTPSGTVS